MKTNPIKQLLKLILLCALFALQSYAQAEIKVTYYIPDASGSPVAATDEQGNVKWRKHYKPFGEQIEQGEASRNNHIGYTGHVHDRSTGLTYMGARYYDPVVGRFMGMDPAGVNPEDPRTFNRFAYANNNPYKYVDPDGRSAVVAVTALGIAAIAYVALAVDPNRQQRIDSLKQGLDAVQQGWKAFNEGGNDDGDTDAVQDEFDSLDAAVGSVDTLDDVELEGKTKNRGLKEQGFTEKWTGVDSDGTYQSGFKNPKTGKWTGGHESSRNNQND